MGNAIRYFLARLTFENFQGGRGSKKVVLRGGVGNKFYGEPVDLLVDLQTVSEKATLNGDPSTLNGAGCG